MDANVDNATTLPVDAETPISGVPQTSPSDKPSSQPTDVAALQRELSANNDDIGAIRADIERRDAVAETLNGQIQSSLQLTAKLQGNVDNGDGTPEMQVRATEMLKQAEQARTEARERLADWAKQKASEAERLGTLTERNKEIAKLLAPGGN